MSLKDLLSDVPDGERKGGSNAYSAAEIRKRKIAVAARVLRASIEGETIRQKRDLWRGLPACEEMQSDRAIGDLLGRAAHGMKLDLEKIIDENGEPDWEIAPSYDQARRVAKWLFDGHLNAAERQQVLVAAGLPGGEEALEKALLDLKKQKAEAFQREQEERHREQNPPLSPEEQVELDELAARLGGSEEDEE